MSESFWKHSELSPVTPDLLDRIAGNAMARWEAVADVADAWDAARVVADGRAPGLWEYNHVGTVRATPETVEKLLNKTALFFRKRNRVPAVAPDPGAQPDNLAALLSARGWTRAPGPAQDLMLWDPGSRHIYTAPEVYMTLATNATLGRWMEIASGDLDPSLHAQARTMYELEYRANVSLWFALFSGAPAGTGTLFVKDGIGQVGCVRVLPEFRGKGVGLALLNFLTRQSRKDGARETYVFNDHDGPATGLCRQTGYHAIAHDARAVWTLDAAPASTNG